jgi:hypothetical protein
VAFFCTDPNASVDEILATVVDRFALETTFRDCKEIVGAGQQQVRFLWANIGAFHRCLWTFTMTDWPSGPCPALVHPHCRYGDFASAIHGFHPRRSADDHAAEISHCVSCGMWRQGKTIR